MQEKIHDKLKEIEARHNVSVLYACESGSRAWGFPSADSDYDVRFIYAHPADIYLGIDDFKDTIDVPVNEVLDINGWDLKKALKLFRNSNAAVYEWLQSPIVYRKEGMLLPAAQAMMADTFSLKDGMHHYLGVARNAYGTLASEEVRLKKYFYCLRSLLAAMWIVDARQLPPMEFGALRKIVIDENWHREVDTLLAIKTEGNESTIIQPVGLLQTFITTSMAMCEEQAKELVSKKADIQPFNRLFKELVYAV